MSVVMNAMAAWLLTYAVHSTLLLGIGFVVLRRTRSAATRDLFWKVAAFGAVLSASVQSAIARGDQVEPFGGRWEISSPPVAERSPAPIVLVSEDASALSGAASRAQGAAGVATVLEPTTVQQAERTPPNQAGSIADASPLRIPRPSWQLLLVVIWGIGTAWSVFFLARRYARARRRFARRHDAIDPELRRSVEELCSRIGLRRRVRVTRCAAVHSPVALGRTEICLPEALLRVLPAPQRTSMLAHELAHLDRNDPMWLAAFGWLEAVLFFQPLNRVARRGFQEAAEQLCDQYALVHTDSPIALAQCLAEVARWLRGESEPLPYPTMGESSSPLVDRVRRVLSGVREPLSTTMRARWSAYGGVLAFAVMAPVFTGTPAIPALSRGTIKEPVRVNPPAVTSQDTSAIAAALRRTTDGVVRFAYATRPSICGTGEEKDGTRMFALKPDEVWMPAGTPDMMALYVWDRGKLMRNDVGVDGTWTTPCNPGPARVDLTVRNGQITAIDLSVADPAPRLSGQVTDLRMIPTQSAKRYLVNFAQQHDNELGGRALVAALLTRDAPTNILLPVLEHPNTPAETRSAALSWLTAIHIVPQDELAILEDKSIPVGERLKVLDRQRENEAIVAHLVRRYDRVPDRAMRVELIDWMLQRENKLVRDKLVAIVKDAVVWEEQQAALRALERSADPAARAFAAGYRRKQPPVPDEIVNARVYNYTNADAPQSELARRIAAAPDGIVHVSYQARPEACGSGIDADGAGMFALLPTDTWHPAGSPGVSAFYSFDRDDFSRLALTPNSSWTNKCVNGPVHILLAVSSGRVTKLQIAVGGPLQSVRVTTEIAGPIPGPEAANYLIELAGRAGQTIAVNAILAAVMADGDALLYDRLIRIAADLSRPERVRQTALHWVALDPTPGAREAIRRNAQSLPRTSEERQFDFSDSPASIGEQSARVSAVQSMPLEVVLRVVLDDRQPLETRKKAIQWAEDKDLPPSALAGLYDQISNRELRLFLVEFLANCDHEATSRKLISIAERDADSEIRRAARTSIRAHQNAVARAYR